MSVPTAGFIVIGNEILSGKITDANTPFLAGRLRELGVRLARVVVIEDDVETIAAAVADAAGRFVHVFTSGGVGPTHDDVTMRGVGAAFDLGLVRHPEFESAIARHYGDGAGEAVLSMADIPEGAELLATDGLFIPVVRVRNVHVFPGVPELFRKKFEAVAAGFGVAPYHLRKLFLDLDEGEIADTLAGLDARFDSVDIGSYPRYDGVDYRVLVTLESKSVAAADAAHAALVAALPAEAIIRNE